MSNIISIIYFMYFRLQLEKAYKLCSPCRKVVQKKLNKEKETLLGAKLLQSRTPEKKCCYNVKQQKFKRLKNVIKYTSNFIGRIFLMLVLIEFVQVAMKSQIMQITVTTSSEIMFNILERVLSVLKAKTFMTFPVLENIVNYIYDIISLDNFNVHIFNEPINYVKSKAADNVNDNVQKIFGGVGCALQIIGHLLEIYSLKNAFLFDIMWTIIVLCVTQSSLPIHGLLLCTIKVMYFINSSL